MKNCTRIRIVQVIIIGFVLFLTSNCKKDNTAPAQTFKITISSDYIVNNYQMWIVVSDNDVVLMSQKLENGQTYEVADLTAKLVDVHIFQYYELLPTQRLTVWTYTDVPLAEWNKTRQYTSSYYGPITVSISDLVNIKNFTVSASRSSSSGSTTTQKTVSAYANPENVLISYLPSDNSAMRYKYVQNVVPAGPTLTYLMSDFQTATGLISYTLPAFNYFSYSLYGYFSNQNIAQYKLNSSSYSYSSIPSLDLSYPSGLFQNYYSNFFFEGPTDATEAMQAIRYGALPSVLPTVSYPDIILSNEDVFDMVTASITDPQNYQEFGLDYYFSQSPVYFQWYVMSQSKSAISNSLPDIPTEIKQKSAFFSKSNLGFNRAYLYKYLSGPASSYNDFISMCIKPSIAFNEVVTEYNIYYKYPALVKKGGASERDRNVPDKDNSVYR